jgi:peptidase E
VNPHVARSRDRAHSRLRHTRFVHAVGPILLRLRRHDPGTRPRLWAGIAAFRGPASPLPGGVGPFGHVQHGFVGRYDKLLLADIRRLLILTSNFPSTVTHAVSDCLRRAQSDPLVAWIPPLTSTGRDRFLLAQETFRSLGVARLELCDIDENPNGQQLTRLDRYDALYFTGGDPLIFRQNMRRHQLAGRLRAFLADGRVIVAASGGAMQLTRNVSPYRLLSTDVDRVVAERNHYDGCAFADYELLPHLNRLDPSFIDKVRRYSDLAGCDVVAIEDGAAIIHTGDTQRAIGRAVRFRGGVQRAIGETEAPL